MIRSSCEGNNLTSRMPALSNEEAGGILIPFPFWALPPLRPFIEFACFGINVNSRASLRNIHMLTIFGRLAKVAAAEKLSCRDNIFCIIFTTQSAAWYSSVGEEALEEEIFLCRPMTEAMQ